MATPRLVMIHGLLAPLACFRAMEPMIQNAQARTIALIGYGENKSSDIHGITLRGQANHVAQQIERLGWTRTWVLGHSVGGAVAMLLAAQRPDLVEAMINAEGNFTLKDAFWSARIAKLPADEWAREYESMVADPVAWINKADMPPSPQAIAWTRDMFASQTSNSIQALAKAVVAETSPPSYLQTLQEVIKHQIPVHLIAGERSAAGWDVPPWMRNDAKSYVKIQGVGHMLMMEDLDAFCRAVDKILSGA